MTFGKVPVRAVASIIGLLVAAIDCGGLDDNVIPVQHGPASATTGSTGAAGSTVTTGTGSSSTITGATGTGSGGSGGSGGAGGSAGSDGSGGSMDAGSGDVSVNLSDGGPDAASGDAGEATFAQVRMLLTTRCAISGCHGNNGGTQQIDLRDTMGLYTRLTGQAPSTAPTACKNHTLISPSMPSMSLLIAMVDTDNAARMGCGARMPDGCPNQRPCLMPAQIQTLKNWVMSGAPMQ